MRISKKATTIAIVNQKGGTGKTTTCENLGIGLAMEGKKVLLVDADPQGSLTISMGWQQPDELPTTLSTLMAKAMNDQSIPPGEGVLHHAEGVDLIPANIELAGMEVSLVNCMNREKMLKQVLEGAKHDYDFILLDCTPSLGMLTVNALAAADTTLIPVQAQYLSAKGLEQLLQTVQKVRRQINPKLKIEGILLTMTDSRTNYPGQCDGQSGYGVTTLDAVVESIVCMKFEEILECSKSNLLEEMRRKDLDAAKKEATRWKEEVQTKVDEQDALKKEMIRVIQGTSGLDREMIQQMVNENKEALLTAQTNLADSEKKLKEIEEQNQKAERNCSDLFTWASTYKGASFERRQAILKQFIKEVRVGRDYNIEIVLNVPLDEFEEFKRHAASAGRGKNQKNKSQNPQKVGRCTSNAGIVVLDKTAGETISIVPKNAAHAILRC